MEAIETKATGDQEQDQKSISNPLVNHPAVLLVNPAKDPYYPSPALGLLFLAAYLRQQGVRADYLDAHFEPKPLHALTSWLDSAPDACWVGFSSTSFSLQAGLYASQIIKRRRPKTKIVFGGPHVSALPESALDYPEVDFVIAKEAEESLLALVSGTRPESVNGLIWKSEESIRVNPPAKFVDDIDTLPFPAYEIGRPKRWNLPYSLKNPVFPVVTSRGCPFRCTFCASHIVHQSRLRYHSERYVEKLFHRIIQLGAGEIHIWDDNFTLHPDRTISLCDRIARITNGRVPLAIPSGVRPDTPSKALWEALKRAGVYTVNMAVESCDEATVLELKKTVDFSLVRETIEAAKKAGVRTRVMFLLGLPGETKEHVRRTIRFARDLPAPLALFFPPIPYPGTALADQVLKNGRILAGNGWTYTADHFYCGKPAFESPPLLLKERKELYQEAIRSFRSVPFRWISGILWNAGHPGMFLRLVGFLVRLTVRRLFFSLTGRNLQQKNPWKKDGEALPFAASLPKYPTLKPDLDTSLESRKR